MTTPLEYTDNQYDEIINGPDTFRFTANALRNLGVIVLNWTDGRGSLFNVLLALHPIRVGSPGGVIDSAPGKLWVGVAGKGMHAFSSDTTYPYVAEKLGLAPASAQALTDLINGVQRDLRQAA